MSKRNLSTTTCSLSQSDFADFVDEYGIALCYDPKLPSSNTTTLDASKGYIPLYMSLFSIGNLHFPLNNFCLDVFEFFQCQFPLLNPFEVAPVTTFVVACKTYSGEATVPLFRDPLPIFTLRNHFMRSCGVVFVVILFKLILFWSLLYIFPVLLILGNMPSKKPEGLRRMSAGGSVPHLSVTAPKGVDVEEAYIAHNMIFGLHYLLLRDKLGKKSLLEHEMSKLEGQLAKAQNNQDVKGCQVVKDLRFENALNLEELSMLRRVAASSKESRKKLVEEVDGL
nr:hypothetical protein [Tanacetum cinerariifolium]